MRINAYLFVAVVVYILAYLCGEEVTLTHQEVGVDAAGRYWQVQPVLALVAMVFGISSFFKKENKES